MTARTPPRRLLWLLAGFTIWSSALILIYALHAIGCAYGWGGMLRPVLALALGAHLAALALAIRRVGAVADGTFVDRVALWTLWAALIATVGVFAPGLFLSTCA